MISDNKISPNYQARAISDLDPGTLFFIERAGTLKPYLLAEGNISRHLVALSDEYLMGRVDRLPDAKQIVYALSQEWRFRLVPALPRQIGNPISDRNMHGKITICKGLRAMTVNTGDDELFLLDIDKLSPADDTMVYNYRGFHSDWIIETRSEPTEPWTQILSNIDAGK